jgi:hypothetical protein
MTSKVSLSTAISFSQENKNHRGTHYGDFYRLGQEVTHITSIYNALEKIII